MSKLIEEYLRIFNFDLKQCVTKSKITVNTVLYASSDILLQLGERRFQVKRRYYLQYKQWSLVMLKMWSISLEYQVQKLKSLCLWERWKTSRCSKDRETQIVFCSRNLISQIFFCCFLCWWFCICKIQINIRRKFGMALNIKGLF